MAKKAKERAEEPILDEELDDPQLQQAKIKALEEEVLTLRELIDALKGDNATLRLQMEQLRATTSAVASSASIAPPPPPPLERPVVEVNGDRYRFKVGEVRLSAREVAKATDIAGDETRLAEVFGRFPGLFEKL